MTDLLEPGIKPLCNRWTNVPRVPLAPFQAVLEHELQLLTWEFAGQAGAVQALAVRIGVDERSIRRWREGLAEHHRRPYKVTDWPQPIIEDALWRLGIRFEDIYPEHAADVDLEPDMWCPTCQQLVTPVSGVCPWDETLCKDDAGSRR